MQLAVERNVPESLINPVTCLCIILGTLVVIFLPCRLATKETGVRGKKTGKEQKKKHVNRKNNK